MKKYKGLVIVCLFLIEICSLFLTCKSYGNKILDNTKEEYEVDKETFSMYIETKDNEGNISYEEYNDSNIFPTGYKINLEKSKCTDIKGNLINGILSGRGNKVTITSNKTAYCYIYFDIDYALSELCSSGDNLGSCLINNNEEIDSLGDTAYSEMYRYTGKNEIVGDNYICFGTDDKETCINNPETYMYRVIGVTSEANNTLGLETNQLKLIKYTSIGTHEWHSDSTTDTNWENSTMYTYLQNDVLNNTTYYPSGWSNKIDSVKWNIGDVQSWTDGNTIYELESSSQTNGASKIGLMYLSDYYYAYQKGGTTNCGNPVCINWLTNSNIDNWTMGRYGNNGSGYYGAWAIYMDSHSGYPSLPRTFNVMPVFYLNSDEQYISGDGTLDNPIMLGKPNLASLCTSGKDLGECLITYNSAIDNLDDTAYGGMYRYTGIKEKINDNYICYGTTNKDDCINNPDEYMYRVIGVTSEDNTLLELNKNQVKIIKDTSIGTHEWHSSYLTDTKWESSTMYSYLQGSEVLGNSNIIPNLWDYKMDSVKWNIGDAQTYTNGDTVYGLEDNNQTTNTSKIGLMYLSDYYYGYVSGGNANCSSVSCSNWLLDSKNKTWTMTRYGYSSSWNDYLALFVSTGGDVYTDSLTHLYSMRPVFYLNQYEKYMSGKGTKEDPIILNDAITAAYGDVDLNGIVSNVDASQINRYLNNMTNAIDINNTFRNADVDNNGVIDKVDSCIINMSINYILSANLPNEPYTKGDIYVDENGECQKKQSIGEYLLANPTTGLNTTTTYSGMYRYIGTSANNYVKLGDVLYRIIGITSEDNTTLGLETGQLKLIKAVSIGTYNWHTSYSVNATWNTGGTDTAMYTYLQGNNVLGSTSVIPNGWQDKISNVKWNVGDVNTTSGLTGSTVYGYEDNTQTSSTSKIGLMYLSDYYYAYNAGGIQNCTSSPYCASWMTDTSGETWTMSRYGYNSAMNRYNVWSVGTYGRGDWNLPTNTYAVRPVFYLNKDVYITNPEATGSSTDPFILSY